MSGKGVKRHEHCYQDSEETLVAPVDPVSHADLLTLIVTTSPTPSEPSTELLSQIFLSFRMHCPELALPAPEGKDRYLMFQRKVCVVRQVLLTSANVLSSEVTPILLNLELKFS
jgi:hypothetical protein